MSKVAFRRISKNCITQKIPKRNDKFQSDSSSSRIETNLAAEEDRESLLEFKRLKLKRFLCC